MIFLAPAAPGLRSEAGSRGEVAALQRQLARLESEVARLRSITTTPAESAPAPVEHVAEVEDGRPTDAVGARCDELETKCADRTVRCAALEQRLAQADGGFVFLGDMNADAAVNQRESAVYRILFAGTSLDAARGDGTTAVSANQFLSRVPPRQALRQRWRAARKAAATNGDAAETPAPAESTDEGDR